MEQAAAAVTKAIRDGKRIALYADYDVDGTMSCVSWIWFFRAIGFSNFIHYIPCRFKEGYGVNLKAVEHLVEVEKAELIITMDTGITANVEAEYCRERRVVFICTDHHKIQPEKMPDCIILNPKFHPDPEYQELCGCGITFVLLRRLATDFPVPPALWTDLLALVGMATICDVVPLNPVNHRLARKGVEGLLKSDRQILKKLLLSAAVTAAGDEKDVGFRLGPRINAVGRLGHADQVIEAFLSEAPSTLIEHMGRCNDERKIIQSRITKEAAELASGFASDPILFLGQDDWHSGVVGIAASKIAEAHWKPTWLFARAEGVAKGSVRSIPGFDVTEAMQSASSLFTKFGGHRAAGGFSFDLSRENEIRAKLCEYANRLRTQIPELWQSRAEFDCALPLSIIDLSLLTLLDEMKPFGHGFEEPRFCIEASVLRVDHYKDKSTGAPRHTAVTTKSPRGGIQKILFFNEVWEDLQAGDAARFIVSLSRNTFQGRTTVSLSGIDYERLQ